MEEQIKHYENKLNYEIDSWDLFESLNNNQNIIVLDTRSPEAYSYEHIPTAVNLPHIEISHNSTNSFDTTALYVTYCDGIGCNASTKGALNMARLGFHVKELIGGIEWWLRDGYETKGTKGKPGKAPDCGC